MKLLTHEGWPRQNNLCPYDEDFVNMAHEFGWERYHIFHLGPGLHHDVGKSLSERNTVLSMTCSVDEMNSYMDWAIQSPRSSGRYQCLFGDVYMIESWTLPLFDVVSLPHLGEMPDESRQEYGAKSDAYIFGTFIEKIAQHGLVFGYPGSSAWDRVGHLFRSLGDPVVEHGNVLGWRAQW